MTTASVVDPSYAPVRLGEDLRGRVAFVTGGTRGIGAAISCSLARQCATVAAGYGSHTAHAEQFRAGLAEELQGHAELSVHRGNVGVPGDGRRTIDEVINQHGRLDILINNAGINIDKTVVKMSDDDWMKVLAVNLSGAFFLTHAALRHMVERGTSASLTCRRWPER